MCLCPAHSEVTKGIGMPHEESRSHPPGTKLFCFQPFQAKRLKIENANKGPIIVMCLHALMLLLCGRLIL